MSTPTSCPEWLQIAEDFERMWQFPNCIGAIDGKHVVICPPSGGGSFYYNYKGTHSVVLMAVAGPNYECLYADVWDKWASFGRRNLEQNTAIEEVRGV